MGDGWECSREVQKRKERVQGKNKESRRELEEVYHTFSPKGAFRGVIGWTVQLYASIFTSQPVSAKFVSLIEFPGSIVCWCFRGLKGEEKNKPGPCEKTSKQASHRLE